MYGRKVWLLRWHFHKTQVPNVVKCLLCDPTNSLLTQWQRRCKFWIELNVDLNCWKRVTAKIKIHSQTAWQAKECRRADIILVISDICIWSTFEHNIVTSSYGAKWWRQQVWMHSYSSSTFSGISSGIDMSPAFLQLTTLPVQLHLAGQLDLTGSVLHITSPVTGLVSEQVEK